MKRICSKEELKEYPIEITNIISETIEILDDNYGVNRHIDNDLGGYVIIAENIVDIEMLKQDKLREIIPEYTNMIECNESINWIYSLFLISSDFSIVVVTTEELSKFLLE
ncbi:hypothetical protein [Clostridium sp. VAP41]|uniref:hypothetical protein n=1 Tax=Clostridium sp. VAP41 TaxID=2949979 RepID=UPI002079BDA1|nr:hypothetical protein [Clostridium sp. VAP41]